ncbi:MAG TPA: zf-HC2 domain-containing protein [Planctomycetota bacterium]
MTCREFTEFLDAYLAGSLPAGQGAAFERHLAVCADCVAYMDSYRRTVDACRGLRDNDQVPPEVPEELVEAILRSRSQGR